MNKNKKNITISTRILKGQTAAYSCAYALEIRSYCVRNQFSWCLFSFWLFFFVIMTSAPLNPQHTGPDTIDGKF